LKAVGPTEKHRFAVFSVYRGVDKLFDKIIELFYAIEVKLGSLILNYLRFGHSQKILFFNVFWL